MNEVLSALGRNFPSFAKLIRVSALVAATLLTLTPATSRATSYASGLTNDNGTIRFYLNESADNVKVILDLGGGGTNDLGALATGRHSFSLGSATNYQIVVARSSGAGWMLGVTNQISSDANILMRFVNQRGVVVNRDPASPYFGRVYVSVSALGTNTASGRVLGEGVYVLNPDFTDALGQGNTALTGGLPFSSASAESPHRLSLGPDGNLYICDWSDQTGTLYVTDPNVGANASAGIVLSGQGGPYPVTSSRIHGSISAAWIEGSLGTANLTAYIIDEDLQVNRDSAATGTERNSLWQWTIGADPLPATSVGVKVGTGPLLGTPGQLADVVRGADGKWYFSQRRADNANTTGIFVRDTGNTTTLWSSLAASREILTNGTATDLYSETAAIDLSYDGKFLAALKQNSNSISFFRLTNGVPNMTNRIVMPVSPTTGSGRDLAFDAAGNIYSVSSGQGLLRVYSPGGATVATTGSDGTFTVVSPPDVTVTASDNLGSELGADTIEFNIVRSGDTASALTVSYTLTGTAVNGTDYGTNTLSATIPIGETNVLVTITPTDDGDAELSETVTLTIVGAANYGAGLPFTATGVITDNEDPNVVTITVNDAQMYERLGGDVAKFTFTRLGDTNKNLFVNIGAIGSADASFDYVEVASQVQILPGVVSVVLEVAPLDDLDVEGDETVTLIVQGGADYVPAAIDSATARIQDDDVPPAPILFSDDFDSEASAGNWMVTFGANNGIFDATTIFGHDYTAFNGIPVAPHSVGGTTKGLFVQVNKTNATALGSAGINLYPVGRSFSGDYALRFDMFLSVGTASTTEHALAGLNHSGTQTNRATQSTDAGNSTSGGDGIWVGIVTDASNLRDYAAYTSTNPASLPLVITNRAASTLAAAINSPPFAFAGSPGNLATSTNKAWADVELRQVNGRVSLRVDNNLVLEFANTYGFTSGNIMIGHNDQFDSVGTAGGFVIFDNVQVVDLGIRIARLQLMLDNTVEIDFTSGAGGTESNYTLQCSASLEEPIDWQPVMGATITALDQTTYRAVAPTGGDRKFYRIVRD